jgi:hypothetical protein
MCLPDTKLNIRHKEVESKKKKKKMENHQMSTKQQKAIVI